MHPIPGRLTVLLTPLLLYACAAGSPAPPGEDYFRERVARDYVEPFRAGDIDRWIEVFAEDAVALHNRRPADEGRAAIRGFGRMVAEHLRLERYDVEVREVRVSGDWALTRGSFVTRFVSRADGSSPFGEEQGKFVLLWARQADG
ncbi:MAG: YybH family protein, partial [Gammaproteobacteria bacterium]